MENKLIEKFKKRLEKAKQEIESKLKILKRPPEFGEDTVDAESFESQEFANQLSVAQTLKPELEEIEAALLKISKNQYGVCEKCGGDISLELLEVAPESRLCRDCKRLSTNFGT